MKGYTCITTKQLKEIKALIAERRVIQKELKGLTDALIAKQFKVSIDTLRIAVGMKDYREYKNKGTRTKRGFLHLGLSQIVKLHKIYQRKFELTEQRRKLNAENISKKYGVSSAVIHRIGKEIEE